MTERIAERAGTDTPRSCEGAVPAGIDSLPFELVAEIFRYLIWPRDLRLAAAVSRRLYVAAWKAGLLIERKIIWSEAKSHVPQLAVFNEVALHAARHPHIRLGLSFNASPETHDDAVLPEMEMESVLVSITAALPVLVRLSFQLHGGFSGSLAHVLMVHAAPRLEELEIDLHTVSDPDVATVSMPSNLFAGAAPNLRTVTLRDAYIGPAPVPAFSGVTHLTLAYRDTFPDIALAAHFPRLRDLSLEFFSDEDWPEPPARVRLDGLRLRRLSVDDEDNCPIMPAVARSLALGAVPVIEHGSDTLEWTQPPWRQDEPLAVRIHRQGSEEDGTVMMIAPSLAPRLWRRSHFVRTWRRDTLAPLAALPGLTRLHIDSAYLLCLFDTPELRLPALRELHIDVHADRILPEIVDADAAPGLRFPQLRTLRLCVYGRGAKPEAGAVAALGRALGVVVDPSPSTVLELAGVKFAVAPGILDKTFAAVRAVSWRSCEDGEEACP